MWTTAINYTKVAVIAFIGVWFINRGLSALGLGAYTTSAAKSAPSDASAS